MIGWWRVVFALVLAVLAGPAAAQKIVVMTPTTINAALAAVQPGDTIRLQGVFSSLVRIRDRDFGGVTIDARAATITGSMLLQRVHNLKIVGGTWQTGGTGTALRIEDSSHVSLSHAQLLGTDRLGTGMRVIRSSFMTVRDNRFEALRNGIIKQTVTDSLTTRNQWLNGGEDGMKLLDSQRVIVSHNSCTGFQPLPTYHPDCIQLWSLAGRPVQSDIHILNNIAIGPQQGLASFDPAEFSGTRIHFVGNLVASSAPHSITCLGCTDSLFADNILISLPDATWIAPLRAPAGSGNVFQNNSFSDLRGQFGAVLPAPAFALFLPDIAGTVGSRWDSRSFGELAAASGVPEPSAWALLLLGLGAAGLVQRRSAFQAALHHHQIEPTAELLAHLSQQADPLEAAGAMQADRGLIA